VSANEQGLAFPSREAALGGDAADPGLNAREETHKVKPEAPATEETVESQASTVAAGSEIDTPSTSQPPSEADSTHPTTPSSAMPPPSTRSSAASHARTATIPAVPLIPIRSAKAPSVASATQKSTKSVADKEDPKKVDGSAAPAAEEEKSAETTPKASPIPKAQPKSWAELLRSKNAPPAPQAPIAANGVVTLNGPAAPKSNTLADALASFAVDSDKKIPFLEPRGLVNSGNMCYMNSVSSRQRSVMVMANDRLDSPSTFILRAVLRFPRSSRERGHPQFQE
jgi:ubiquitin carboxyl-terminal hydrolase 10